jgi:hypothetical protein
MDISDKISITNEIFRDLEIVMTTQELEDLYKKLCELKNYSDVGISASTEYLCARIFWHLDEIEREKNAREFAVFIEKKVSYIY